MRKRNRTKKSIKRVPQARDWNVLDDDGNQVIKFVISRSFKEILITRDDVYNVILNWEPSLIQTANSDQLIPVFKLEEDGMVVIFVNGWETDLDEDATQEEIEEVLLELQEDLESISRDELVPAKTVKDSQAELQERLAELRSK